jgi:catechol 2,3-dioxygenase-like lactoylglutathione lyase family enzyme
METNPGSLDLTKKRTQRRRDFSNEQASSFLYRLKSARKSVVKTHRWWCWVVGLVVIATYWPGHAQVKDNHPPKPNRPPMLVNTCVITNDVKRLVDFYEPVLLLKAKWTGEDYAEFFTGQGVLAVFSAQDQEKYIPGSSKAEENKSVVLEFRVTDVDREYRRLQSLVKVWVKLPTTQPWGTRSIYFRDPDGNLVDFYAPAKGR